MSDSVTHWIWDLDEMGSGNKRCRVPVHTLNGISLGEREKGVLSLSLALIVVGDEFFILIPNNPVE
jgi:hypothetical protein